MDFFNAFPSQWEWVALIIGGLGFLMAVQPFTQVIWGRPQINVSCRSTNDHEWWGLLCEVMNLPVGNRVLRWLRVYRQTAESVFVTFSIFDDMSKHSVFETSPYIETYAGEQAQVVSMPARNVPSTFWVAHYDKSSDKAYAGGSKEGGVLLPHGLYHVVVTVYEGGINRKVWRNAFVVQENEPCIRWVA